MANQLAINAFGRRPSEDVWPSLAENPMGFALDSDIQRLRKNQ
jgi:hypothetical protein